MLLANRNAIVYGGGGSIGTAVARGFAREGATVYLVGRTPEPLERTAEVVRAEGGTAHTAVVDALDEAAVEAHAESVATEAGSLDVSMNLVSMNDVQGTPLLEMSFDDFDSPIRTWVKTNFLTARAAARRMVTQKRGVILFFGGDGDPLRGYHLGGLQVAFTAVEAFRRALANEVGPYGVRALTLRTSGIVEAIPEGFEGREKIVDDLVGATMLGRAATFEDVGRVAAFAASDHAAAMTATTLNISAGTMVD
jgi:NAD(P)-dependent dehydrogenase (short-subunit alcohol dehydrogenase family)